MLPDGPGGLPDPWGRVVLFRGSHRGEDDNDREGTALESASASRNGGRLRGSPAWGVRVLPDLFRSAARPQSSRTGRLRCRPTGFTSTLTRRTRDATDRGGGGRRCSSDRPVCGPPHTELTLDRAAEPVRHVAGMARDPNRTIVIVVDDDQDIPSLVWQTLNVGFEPPKGRLAGGIAAWRAAGRPVTEIDLVPAGDVRADRAIVDVRQLSEWQTNHVTGAIHVELGDIVAQTTQLEGDIQLHCGHGQRAMSAASLLEQAGVETLAVITGGPREISAALARGRPSG